jgi:hypothetical protein
MRTSRAPFSSGKPGKSITRPRSAIFGVQGSEYRSPRVRRTTLLITIGLLSPSLAAATYHYEAYFAGLRVGSAIVEVDRDSLRYQIKGSAAARGVATFFSDWQSEFYATGVFADSAPELLTYGYDERERKKRRILRLADGTVETTRNGKARPAMPVLDGLDVLTAFFIVPACWDTQVVHTGRYNYRLDGRRARQEGCDFQVRDDDGDRSRVNIRFGEHQGHLVPTRLSTGVLLKGRIILKRSEANTTTYADLEPFSR